MICEMTLTESLSRVDQSHSFHSGLLVNCLFPLTSNEKFDQLDLPLRFYSAQSSFVRWSLKNFDERLHLDMIDWTNSNSNVFGSFSLRFNRAEVHFFFNL